MLAAAAMPSGSCTSLQEAVDLQRRKGGERHFLANVWPRLHPTLPILVYLLGTEGSGHNAWERILKSLPSVRLFKGCVAMGPNQRWPADPVGWQSDDFRQRLFAVLPDLGRAGDASLIFVLGEDALPCGGLARGRVDRYPDFVAPCTRWYCL